MVVIITTHGINPLVVVWDRAGDRLAVSGDTGSIQVWNSYTGTLDRTLNEGGSTVCCLAWSPTSDVLASGSWNCSVKLWKDRSPVQCVTFDGHLGFVKGVAWNPSGTLLASCSNDNTIKVWDVFTGGCVCTLAGVTTGYDFLNRINSVAWNPAGTLIASASNIGVIHVFDPVTKVCQRALDGGDSVATIKWSPAGNRLASTSTNSMHNIKIWDTDTGAYLRTLPDSSVGVAWSPTGKVLASASGMQQIFDCVVKLWSPDTGVLLRSLSVHTDELRSVAWNSARDMLASISCDGTLALWTCCVMCGLPSEEVDDHPRGGRCWECVDKLQERDLLARLLQEGQDTDQGVGSRILPADVLRIAANIVVGLHPSTTQFHFSLLCV